MKINVGTKNPVKISAVAEIIKDYEKYKDAEIVSVEAESLISEQPLSIDETIQGAMNRARNCFSSCELSIGLESGLMKVPNTKTGFMDFTCCAIFDGKQFHLGLSSAFEFPVKVVEKIFNEKIDSSSAFHKLGLSKNNYVGYAEGIIGVLTKGRLNRKQYTQQALRTAFIHLENPELY